MKVALFLIVLAVIATAYEASVIEASSRADLSAGSVIDGDWLIYKTVVFKPAIDGVIQSEDVIYHTYASTRISAVQAAEMGEKQGATAYIVQGGIGQSNVTVRFTSVRGFGINYMLDIWGLN